MNDLISIVVPVYNVEKYLVKCVNSLIEQTYKNIEILLINDGSTDESLKICNNLSKLDSRILVYDKKNGGLSDARNYGIERVKGKYILFVDSDDYINKDMINILYENLKNNNCDISVCGIQKYDDNTLPIENISKKEKNRVYLSTEDIINSMVKDNFVQNYATNKLFSIKLFNEIRFPVKKNYEDIQTIYRLFLKSKGMVVSPLKLYYYYQRNDSIHATYSDKNILDLFDAINSRYTNLKNLNLDTYYLKKDTATLFVNCYYRVYKSKSSNVRKYIVDNKLFKYYSDIFGGTLSLFMMLSMKNKIKLFILFLVYKRL